MPETVRKELSSVWGPIDVQQSWQLPSQWPGTNEGLLLEQSSQALDEPIQCVCIP